MAKAAQPTVSLKHLAAGLAAEHDMAKKHSKTVFTDFVGRASRKAAFRAPRN